MLVLTLATMVVCGLAAFVVKEAISLHQAHSTFANYYAFRDCSQLLEKTATYGVCKTASGATIKIVEFRGRWYLDGDLPFCLMDVCL